MRLSRLIEEWDGEIEQMAYSHSLKYAPHSATDLGLHLDHDPSAAPHLLAACASVAVPRAPAIPARTRLFVPLSVCMRKCTIMSLGINRP